MSVDLESPCCFGLWLRSFVLCFCLVSDSGDLTFAPPRTPIPLLRIPSAAIPPDDTATQQLLPLESLSPARPRPPARLPLAASSTMIRFTRGATTMAARAAAAASASAHAPQLAPIVAVGGIRAFRPARAGALRFASAADAERESRAASSSSEHKQTGQLFRRVCLIELCRGCKHEAALVWALTGRSAVVAFAPKSCFFLGSLLQKRHRTNMHPKRPRL